MPGTISPPSTVNLRALNAAASAWAVFVACTAYGIVSRWPCSVIRHPAFVRKNLA